jgi:hypothetical protein
MGSHFPLQAGQHFTEALFRTRWSSWMQTSQKHLWHRVHLALATACG